MLPIINGTHEAKLLSAADALSGSVDLGKSILIVGGGGIGAEVADYLSENGKEVTLIEMREGIAMDLPGQLQHFLNTRLKEKGVNILTSTKAIRLEKDGLYVENLQGTRILGGFDSIIISFGLIPNNELVESLKGKIPEVYVVGDALKPREMMEAVSEGEEIALKI